MDLFTKQQKQQNKRVKAAISGVCTPRSSYAGSRRSPPPSKSVQRTNHSLTFSEPSVPEEGTSFDRKRILLMHRTEPLSHPK
jgi:hypothetical protein